MTSYLKKPIHLRNGYKDESRLKAVRNLPCLACKIAKEEQTTKTEAHHLIGYGLGLKPSDLKTIPLCKIHHDGREKGISIHSTILEEWENTFDSQERLLDKTNQILRKQETISAKEYQELIKKQKPSKYRSKKVKYIEDGEEKVKDSQKEYSRLIYLRQLEKEGKISDLQEQVPFLLQEAIRVNGRTLEKAIKYIADYTYSEGGDKIVEDVKSKATKKNHTYILKRKLFRARYPEYIFREV